MQTSTDRSFWLVSFAVSLIFWAWLLGSVDMGIGFLVLLFVHEMGHYYAAKRKGIAVSPPTFTPIGAFISMPNLPKRADDEAYMAYAGPLLGTVGGIVTLILGDIMGVQMLQQLAWYAFLLNLFNLIPLAPLDGGRISMAIDRRMWVLGVPLILLLLVSGSPYNAFIAVFILWQAWLDVQMRSAMAMSNPRYFQIGFKARLCYAIAYVALAAFLVYAVTSPHGLTHFFNGFGL